MPQCTECGHSVSKGNRHRKGSCPPVPKPGFNRSARKAEERAIEAKALSEMRQRGMPIAHTGKGSTSESELSQ